MGGKAPKAPDLTPLAEISEEIGRESIALGREQLDWAKEQYGKSLEITERVLGVQLPMMEDMWRQSQDDRKRYEQLYQPLEDNLIKEFESYASPERIALERGRAVGDVAAAFESQRNNAAQQLESFGIDPSMTRHQALDVAMRTDEAKAKAFAANQATQTTENMGRALRAEAINIGRGYPGQTAQMAGLASNTGAQAQGGFNQGFGAANTARGSANQWYGTGLSGINQGAGIRNMGYQNQMAQYQANMTLSPLAQAAQMGSSMAGMWLGGGMGAAEGGAVPEGLAPTPQPGDAIPVMLQPGEFVVRKEAVEAKGKEFFQRFNDKYDPEQQAIPEQRYA